VETSSGSELPDLPPNPDPRCRRTAVLACHPASPCAAVQSLEATACLLDGQRLALGFSLRGDLDRLHFPTPGAPRRAERLWEHTCFEAFLALPGQDAYWELNLAPSTEWAAYRFRRYREGGAPAPDLEPRISIQRSPGRLDLQAVAALPALDTRRGLQIGLSAVLEAMDGPLSYWALRHGPGRPDFHLRAAFALELPSGAQA
jgi:hypothetical protein